MRRRTATLAVTLGALALPTSASAMVQVDRGIAGARLNATRGDVRAALGRPSAVRSGSNDFGRFLEYRYRGGIRVVFQGRRRVTSVSTSGLGDRTATGVGVGSTEAEVKAGVRRVRCETIAGTRSCHTRRLEAGQRVTDFLLGSNGTVKRITVGFVID
jgi:hypothetical protein